MKAAKEHDTELLKLPLETVAGVDEAGRGPLAGSVVAAAVMLNPAHDWSAMRDSKQLSATKREQLFDYIQAHALAFAICEVTAEEIDSINILQASLKAQAQAVMALAIKPASVIVDGCYVPKLPYPTASLIKGDQLHPAISAASILAKVSRDRDMLALDEIYPGYGFAKHKGYGTKAHLLALKKLGPCSIHRRSFKPVQLCLAELA